MVSTAIVRQYLCDSQPVRVPGPDRVALVMKAVDLKNCQWQNALAIGKEKPNTKTAK